MHPDETLVREMAASLGCSRLLAELLVNRNFHSAEAAVRFLNPSLNHIRSPFALKDMDLALARLQRAVIGRENIMVFGDYDADGVTATAVLYDFFRQTGTPVSYYIPHRINEGYSLHPDHIGLALSRNTKLIVTADCGSASGAAMATAKQKGVDVIVTDHHQISQPPPGALAVINPNRHDCEAGLEHLAGVGVAFCLLICLRKKLRDIDFWSEKPQPNLKHLCDLVALGTVADIVPLREENRIFTCSGLNVMQNGGRIGLAALIRQSRLDQEKTNVSDIAFRLAPRINAAGRMDHAGSAVELLLTDDPDEAARLARRLDELNSTRQEFEGRVIDDISRRIDKDPALLERHSLVLSGSDWHEGVIGIAASKLLELYYKPVALISTRDTIAKGSARSISGFDLYSGLAACRDYLMNFGGHSLAAGFSIRPEQIEAFIRAFEDRVRQKTSPLDYIKKIPIDLELDFNEITPELVDEIERLKPFGTGNPEPLFIAREIQIAAAKIVGKYHRKMQLTQNGRPSNKTLDAIQFNIDPVNIATTGFAQIAYRLRWNHWNGKRTIQLIIEDTKPDV